MLEKPSAKTWQPPYFDKRDGWRGGVRNLLLERQHDMKYETEEETKKVVGGKVCYSKANNAKAKRHKESSWENSATQKPTTQRQKDTKKVLLKSPATQKPTTQRQKDTRKVPERICLSLEASSLP